MLAVRGDVVRLLEDQGWRSVKGLAAFEAGGPAERVRLRGGAQYLPGCSPDRIHRSSSEPPLRCEDRLQ
jgi:hypothetical protein